MDVSMSKDNISKAADMTRLLIAWLAKLSGARIVVKSWAVERAAVALRQEQAERDEAKR